MSFSTTTSTTNIATGDPSISSSRKGSSLLDDPAFSSAEPTVTTDTKQTATSSSTLSPPPPAPPMGHDHSKEKMPERQRRRSSVSSHSRSSGHSTANVPGISLPTPNQPTHHRSSSVSQQLPIHRRTASGSSQSGRSPSPGATGVVLPSGVSISQITPNIFVGNNASSTSIPTLMHYGITSMVSLLSTSEQALNEEAWNSPALEMLVPKQNRLFVRCEDSPEEDLVGRLGMICDFIDEQVEGVPGSGPRRRKQSVEDVLASVLPASEVPKGFNAAGQEPAQPKQRVRSLIPDSDGNFESPQPESAQGAEDLPDLTKKKSAGPAPQKQRVRSLIPDDVGLARGGPAPVPSVPSGSIPSVPSAPVPSLPGQSSQSHLSPGSASSSRSGSNASASQLSALSPSAQAGPFASSPATSPSLAPSSPSMDSQGGKVLIHCNQGVSRSGAACVAYIMKQNPKWSVDKALRFVQVKRKEVEPSENFLGQLEVWKECRYEVWEDAATKPGEGLTVDGKSIDGKGKGQGKKVEKEAYKKWLAKREKMIKRVREMGGLVRPVEVPK